MCKLFINADPQLWVSRTHSLRIDGMVTSVRIEDAFWRVLEEVAERDGMNLPQMITRLYHESIDAGHDLGNFTSFLRVCAMRYLALQLSGDIPADTRVAIASLDAEGILAREPASGKPHGRAGKTTH
ncbi:hypothetical protein MA04_02166 [Alcanivorax balearicus MACL04]|uniref:Ribbon-helix-helix domain-containing protein n=1 Tax=Alloalcanivorax balearicus MACL04 TaxID=1177182 RepID=A0ABT2QZC4_9GAMM|nr:ribbon-helix-helix domain-containing protein [Alloalcanivorax balearicus]MCU5782866.1 hypothetical protein [Alloalcanivorax balearicus MACL04]